jgi:hypothetical protein
MIRTYSVPGKDFEIECGKFIREQGFNRFVDTMVRFIEQADPEAVWENDVRTGIERLNHVLSKMLRNAYELRTAKNGRVF